MFFETRCAVCDCRGQAVCDRCSRGFRRVPSGTVRIQGDPQTVVRAVFELETGIRSVVAAVKYQRERRLSRWVAQQMAHLVPRGSDALVWVPATPQRVRQRGFDQAREITAELSALTGVPARQLLKRAYADDRQTDRRLHERTSGPSLHAAVALRDRGAPELVTLVDDIVTTGSSLQRAASVLSTHGAHKVVPLVLAATPLRSRPYL